MKTTEKPSGNSFPTGGPRNPNRTNLDQLFPTLGEFCKVAKTWNQIIKVAIIGGLH